MKNSDVPKVDWNKRYIESDTPWDSGLPSEELKNILASGLIKPCRVLELGCGTGTNAIFLSQAGFQVTAVDLSEVALERAREKSAKSGVAINFMQADVTQLPYDGPPFSFVFDRGTYHIVRHVNLSGLQKLLSRVIEPGGYYVVLAGNANDSGPADSGPPRVSAGELCRELEFDSFDLVELKEAKFDGVEISGQMFSPLAWRAILRRRSAVR